MNFHWCFRAMLYGAEGECFELSAGQTPGWHAALFQGTPWNTATCVSFCTFGSLVAYTASLLKPWELCVGVHQVMEQKSKTSMRGEQWGGVAVLFSGARHSVWHRGLWVSKAARQALGGCCSVLWNKLMSWCFLGWIQHHFPTRFPGQTGLLLKVCDARWPWQSTSSENAVLLRLHKQSGFSTFSSTNLYSHVCILTVNKHQIHLWW